MVLLKVTIQNRWRTIQIGSWDSVKADHHHLMEVTASIAEKITIRMGTKFWGFEFHCW